MEEKLNEIAGLAKKVHEMNEARLVISVTGIGGPEVLLTSDGWRLLFPDDTDAEERIIDGDTWRVYFKTAGGVLWKCWEQVNV